MRETMHESGQRIYGKPVPYAQFCCKPKTALKNKVLKKEDIIKKI